MTAYLHDHFYCTDSLEFILLSRMNSVKLSDIPKLEKKTRKDCRLWRRLRKTRITASVVHDVIRTCRSRRLATPLATGFLDNHFREKPFLSKAMKWGIVNEQNALKAYCNLMGRQFSKCDVIIDQERHYLSATPDAISDKKDVIVKIKYSVRHDVPQSAQYLQSGMLKTNDQILHTDANSDARDPNS